MPFFAIIALDAPNSKAKRVDYLKPHAEALATIKNEGRLFAAGPLRNSIDDSAENLGSLLIIDFNSQAEAEAWFQDEPYSKAGVYQSVTIKPYVDAMDFISTYRQHEKVV